MFEDPQDSEGCVTQVCQRQSGMYHVNHCFVQFIDEEATLACAVQAELCRAVEDGLFVFGQERAAWGRAGTVCGGNKGLGRWLKRVKCLLCKHEDHFGFPAPT